MARRHIAMIVLLFVAMHGLLFVHDVRDPDAFLSGDRAGIRLEKIHYLLDGPQSGQAFEYMRQMPTYQSLFEAPALSASFLDRLTELGDPGDYAVHAVPYALGGPVMVIAVQVALALLSVVCVYRLAQALGQPGRLALMAALVYMLLPGSLMQPHQLVAEAIFNPLVVLALFLIVRNVEGEFRIGAFLLALAAMSMAILMRHQLLLYPFLLALILGYAYRRQWLSKVAPVLMVSFALPLAWMLFIYIHTGEFSSGPSDHSFGLNLFIRMERMGDIAGVPLGPSDFPDRDVSPGAFLSYVLAHPSVYLRTVLSDLANTLFNPGVNQFAARYLDIFDTPADLTYWRNLRDREGLLGVGLKITRLHPAFAISFFVFTAAWTVLLSLATIGVAIFVRDGRTSTVTRAVLVSYLVYGIAVVQLAGGVRWTHRTPIEFVIVLMSIAAIRWFLRRCAAVKPISS